MNCPNCGTSNVDTASICVNCGRPLHSAAPTNTYTPPPPPPPSAGAYTPPPPHAGAPAGYPVAAPIPNYLVQSIIATLCCCLPLGIVAIIFSAQVNSRLAAGDVAGAADASSKARLFCWLSFGIGILGFLIAILVNGAAFLSALAGQ